MGIGSSHRDKERNRKNSFVKHLERKEKKDKEKAEKIITPQQELENVLYYLNHKILHCKWDIEHGFRNKIDLLEKLELEKKQLEIKMIQNE